MSTREEAERKVAEVMGLDLETWPDWVAFIVPDTPLSKLVDYAVKLTMQQEERKP